MSFVVWLLYQLATALLWPPCSLRHNNIEIRPMNNLTINSVFKWKKQLHTKARNDWASWGKHVESQEKLKARPLKPVTLSQPIVHAKETLPAEIKCATPVNPQMLREWNTLIADNEQVLRLEDQTSHSIPFSRSLIHSKGPKFLQFYEDQERWRNCRREVWSWQRCFMRLKERSHLPSIRVQGDISSVDVEAAAVYLEDLAKIIHHGGYTEQLISMWMNYPYTRRRYHPELS